ncbi:MAG: YigZ family protein [Balneolaceae bacterium]|nr:YigZ family protein [Balneolaceae bacterium]
MGYLFPCRSEDEFSAELAQLKSKYPDATHHCYGWRLNPAQIREFSTDDGEPSGTAGLPILNQLKSFEVVNAGIIVVRYYGGTKLGKPGLIEAYGGSARLCLEKARLFSIVSVHEFEICYPYSRENQISKLKNDFGLQVVASEYMEDVTLKVACPADKAERFEQQLQKLEHLKITFEKLGKSFVRS